jgi:hypothetical protein
VLRTARVQKPYKGCLAHNRVLMRDPDEAKRRPIETLGRRRMWRLRQIREARERRSGEIPIEAFAKTLEGRNPGEHPADGVLNTRPDARDSRKGRSPGTAACRAGLSGHRREQGQAKRYVGASGAVTHRIPFERGKLRRVNPMSAAGVRQNRHGVEGRKPPRG